MPSVPLPVPVPVLMHRCHCLRPVWSSLISSEATLQSEQIYAGGRNPAARPYEEWAAESYCAQSRKRCRSGIFSFSGLWSRDGSQDNLPPWLSMRDERLGLQASASSSLTVSTFDAPGKLCEP